VSGTGIVAALTAEARTLGPVRANQINTLADGTLLIISGMGPQAAMQAALTLVGAGARSLLSFGLAGALDPQLRAGAVLLPAAVTDGTGAVHRTCDAWRERLAMRAAAGTRDHGGTLLSVTEPLMTVYAKSEAWGRTHACAVDMESFAIGSVAMRKQVHFAVARVVIDTAADSLPPSVTRATDSRGGLNYPRLVSGLLRSPAEMLALLRLARRYRAAMGSLRQLAQRGLGLP
jgi:adenosylhomocysteine nucleosidase